MNRRDTLLALLALGAAPAALRAQPAPRAKPFRIGMLPGHNEPYRKLVAGLIGEFGWIEGRDFILVVLDSEYRSDQMDAAARRMVAANPDLILVGGNGYTHAAQRLTTTIPIVVVACGYPVEDGLVKSLARPGGNITGISLYVDRGIWGKLVELLRDAKPGIKRVGVLEDYVPPHCLRETTELGLRQMRQDAATLGIKLHIVEVPFPDRLPAALAKIEAARPDALIATSGPGLWVWHQRVAQFAVDKRLPLITDFPWLPVDPYPMLVYGPSGTELTRNAVSYVDRILKGAKPGDLPMQLPSKFELVVNLKAAKAIGLTIPQLFLLRADAVIE